MIATPKELGAHAGADLPLLRYLDEDGRFISDDAPEIPVADVVDMYKVILGIRALEERMIKLQRQGRIGFYVGTLGEEATHVGATYALRDTDLIFPAYRENGPVLMRGMSLETFIDQLFGNAQDALKGRQMPNHHSARSLNLASISSPVGTQIPQCAGSAWAAKIRGTDQVSLCFFGDGTSAEGDFHVGLNFAAVFKAPAIFFLRNNGWAISGPSDIQSATETFHVKARAYGMTGVRVDGNDIFAVVGAVRQAAERARRGEGPTLIEGVTYRIGAHSTSDDPTKYRATEEVDRARAAEPVVRLRKLLQREGHFTQEAEDDYVADVARRVQEIARAAEARPAPELPTLFDDVYEELPWHIRRQRDAALGA